MLSGWTHYWYNTFRKHISFSKEVCSVEVKRTFPRINIYLCIIVPYYEGPVYINLPNIYHVDMYEINLSISGITRSTTVCLKKDDRKIVNKKYCSPNLRPKDRAKTCNDEPCPPA